VVGKARVEIVEYRFSVEVALARSGLCSGPTQARLEEALLRIEKRELQQDHTAAATAPALVELRSAYDAALDELERSLPDGADDAGPLR
jgi:hypothetical protein